MSPTPPRHPGAGGAARHAAIKVHKDSHSIHKAAASPLSSSSTNSSVSSSSTAAAITSNGGHHRPPAAPRQKPPPPQPQQQQPVIIYTHSPKVIRTNPSDFMSIVQKLTGLDRGAPPAAARTIAAAAAAQDESSSSSSESCANAHAAGPLPPPYALDTQLMPPPAAPPLDAHHLMAPDMPLFAPDAAELQQLCAPRGLYGGQFDAAAALGPAMATTVNGGGVFSPSMAEAMRTFHDYN